jgi:hypothetical protein
MNLISISIRVQVVSNTFRSFQKANYFRGLALQ